MAEIVKSFVQDMPPLRFIGKKYFDNDRVDGMFGAKWGEWFSSGWFGVLENLIGDDLKAIYEDGDAYIGLMRDKQGDPFEYWIGIFMPAGTAVPDGFELVDFPAGRLGVCWVYGKEPDVYCKEPLCYEKLLEQGFKIALDPAGACFFFERYGCPRFTTPDDRGNIILDVCFFIA